MSDENTATTDPAVRLMKILQSALKSPNNQSFLAFWAAGFGISQEKITDIYYHLGLLNAVVRSINEYQFRGIRGVREELFVIASRIQERLPGRASGQRLLCLFEAG